MPRRPFWNDPMELRYHGSRTARLEGFALFVSFWLFPWERPGRKKFKRKFYENCFDSIPNLVSICNSNLNLNSNQNLVKSHWFIVFCSKSFDRIFPSYESCGGSNTWKSIFRIVTRHYRASKMTWLSPTLWSNFISRGNWASKMMQRSKSPNSYFHRKK